MYVKIFVGVYVYNKHAHTHGCVDVCVCRGGGGGFEKNLSAPNVVCTKLFFVHEIQQ